MKYKPYVVGMLVIVFLWLVRCLVSGTIEFYGFVIWNSFLATIPLLLEPVFKTIQRELTGLYQKICKLVVAAAWLLFLPNAFYILTDFMHLNPRVLVNERGDSSSYIVHYMRGDGVYMLDTLLLFVTAVYGAYVGGLALLHAYTYFKRRIPQWVMPAIGGVMLLSAIGVYIGRFGRWNSWDGLIRPWHVASDLWSSLSDTFVRNRFLTVVLTIFIFQILCMWAVSRIVNQPRNKLTQK